MDSIDLAILGELQRDGRITNAELAERVHLSPSPCLRRLKRLEEDGTIRGYRAVLDRRKVGLDLTVFTEIKTRNHKPEKAHDFENAVVEVGEIVSCHVVAGTADYVLEIAVADLAAYEQLFLNTLLALPGLSDSRTNVAIRTVKEDAPLPLPAA
jgi:Lrp/AsnC family leucine-responsive transcriptional regulator